MPGPPHPSQPMQQALNRSAAQIGTGRAGGLQPIASSDTGDGSASANITQLPPRMIPPPMGVIGAAGPANVTQLPGAYNRFTNRPLSQEHMNIERWLYQNPDAIRRWSMGVYGGFSGRTMGLWHMPHGFVGRPIYGPGGTSGEDYPGQNLWTETSGITELYPPLPLGNPATRGQPGHSRVGRWIDPDDSLGYIHRAVRRRSGVSNPGNRPIWQAPGQTGAEGGPMSPLPNPWNPGGRYGNVS